MNRTTFSTLRIVGVIAALLAATAGAAQAQRAVVRGTVVSEAGQPVDGASLFIPELGIQTATDNAGKYTITIPGTRVRGQTANLRVRMIGYRPSSRALTVTAGDQVFDFTLAADVNRLEEIVVTGMLEGTEKTRVPFDLTRVDAADLPVPAIDPLRMLAGRVPGANIVSGSGRPGNAPAVLLRGPTSIDATGRSQEPLYVVDGVIINGNLPAINAADIENVEVVKGAAASSLYGARAGNGVIQITTKTARRSRDGMTFSARSEIGSSDIERETHLSRLHSLIMDPTNTRFCVAVSTQPMCARSYDWVTEAARINNALGDFSASPVGSVTMDPGSQIAGLPLRNSYQAKQYPGRIYDAVKQVVQPRMAMTNNLDATGRFGETRFYASGSQTSQAGAIRFLKGYDRWTGRLNVDQRIGSTVSFGLRSYYAHSSEDGLNTDGGNTAFFKLSRVPAIVNVLQTDTLGRLFVRTNLQNAGTQNENPLIQLQGVSQAAARDRFIGGVTMRWGPASWVDLEANASYDYSNYVESYFRDKGYRATTSSSANSVSIGRVNEQQSESKAFNTSLNLTLRHDFARDLGTRWSLRYLYEQQDNDNRSGTGTTLAAVGVPALANAGAGFSLSSGRSSIRLIGLFAGVSVDYKDRYVLEGLMRRDGTSLYGVNNRWATFGRGSVAWRVSQEPWWFASSFMNELKLRASRGSAGGRPSFTAQYETFSLSAGQIGYANLGNKDLKPEITTESELGADIEILRKIGLTVTHAQSTTTDQILLTPVASLKGFGLKYKNAGTLENKTWELSLNVPIIQRRDMSWSWRFSYDRTRTVITKLDVPPFTFGVTQQGAENMFFAREGERLGTMYGKRLLRSCSELPASFQSQCGTPTSNYQQNDAGFLVWTGGYGVGEGITRNLYQTSLSGAQAPWGVALNWGMLITMRDTSCIAAPRSDCPAASVPLGNALPSWNFSITQTFQWRRLNVYALLQGSMGRNVWNEGRHWSYLDFTSADIDQAGVSVEHAKPIGYYYRSSPPEHAAGINGAYQTLAPNNYFVEDASYAKLRELAVSYNVGSLGGMGDWTVSVIGRNLFTITGYHGFDPEVGIAGSTTSSAAINAVDAFVFPNTRSLTFALSTSF